MIFACLFRMTAAFVGSSSKSEFSRRNFISFISNAFTSFFFLAAFKDISLLAFSYILRIIVPKNYSFDSHQSSPLSTSKSTFISLQLDSFYRRLFRERSLVSAEYILETCNVNWLLGILFRVVSQNLPNVNIHEAFTSKALFKVDLRILEMIMVIFTASTL